ncbi:ANTAR domain-containing protein [Streptomyces luteogriseus]|nr:ANTAR domain-containing protein [Streptomyces luteogriseus]
MPGLLDAAVCGRGCVGHSAGEGLGTQPLGFSLAREGITSEALQLAGDLCVAGGSLAAPVKGQAPQLRQAVDSHAKVDQAIGVLVAVHRIEPAAGVEMLREVSQHTNVRLRPVAGDGDRLGAGGVPAAVGGPGAGGGPATARRCGRRLGSAGEAVRRSGPVGRWGGRG